MVILALSNGVEVTFFIGVVLLKIRGVFNVTFGFKFLCFLLRLFLRLVKFSLWAHSPSVSRCSGFNILVSRKFCLKSV